jgi:hypothetical protein
MNEPPVATDEEIKQLLRLAKVPLSDGHAASWLMDALAMARYQNRNNRKRLSAADHNDILDGVAKTTKYLIKQLRRLRSHPYSWQEFWSCAASRSSPGFLGEALSEADVQELLRQRIHVRRHLDDQPTLATLERIERAANTAKEQQKGRPRDVRKQRVVMLAAQFLIRHSPLRLSGSATGQFAGFARAFYSIALDVDDPDDDGGLDRQIRATAKQMQNRQEHVRV